MTTQGSEPPSDHANPWRATRSLQQLDHIVELPELLSHGSAAAVGPGGSIAGAQLVDEPIAKKDDDAFAEEGGVYAEVRTRSRSASTASWFGSVGSRLLGRKSKSLESSLDRSSGEASPQLPEGVRLAAVTPFDDRLNSLLVRIQARRPRLGRALVWVRGPSPPHIETIFPPFPLLYFGPRLARFERWCTARLMPLQRRRHLTTPVFLLAWLLAFAFLVRASFFTSSTNFGAPTWVDATSSFWSANAGCGINGTTCQPFTNDSFVFRCPSQVLSTQLLNYRAVGNDLVIYQPLVVGGMDSQSTYRADSWICAAAIQHGLFDDRRGGCGEVEMVGEFTGYVGGRRNGVASIAFASTFPSSYRFIEGVSQNGCKDLRDDILGFDVAMTFILSFFIRPGPQAFFWSLLCIGAWHVILVSNPSAMPPDLQTAFENFLPVLFVGESFWRHAWRWVAPAFESSGFILERTVWYLAGFWVGLLMNISLHWIPIDRLTPHAISQEPGSLVAVIVVAIFLLLVIVNQLRVIRRTGWFFFYLRWYIVGGVVVGILSALPGLEFRLHHYVAAILLMPGTAFVTRPSAIFQGFLLGMFLEGAMRWGMASILQTPASLVGDGTTGSPLPVFLTNATNFAAAVSSGYIQWSSIPADVAGQGYDGFALLVDDVLRQTGAATNYSLAALDANVVHYFRLAYQQGGTSGDFTKAATAFLSNSTWINPASGPS
ncbi:LCCL domain containing protein [Rhodotorula toruloides]|uniref:LCCL domain containing protein n=1 Tax=Rhodotorula toruloides TaxID=5286 RepID=A0A511KI60_RHOTO|nr:LCCL domain containing protein [Rhodotorula toruloides]